MAATYLSRGYWMGKARSKKSSPWLKVAAVIAILWVWGHVHHTADTAHTSRPAAHSSPTAGPHARR